MKQAPTPKTAALYARVSSNRQDVDLSVSAQLRALRDYAEKNGYAVVSVYVDEAESGRVADRPQFRKMLDAASADDAPFEEILVWKFSRFTRKREHAVAFKSMLRRRGVKVTSITEHADDSPTGKLMEAIIESVDEFYSARILPRKLSRAACARPLLVAFGSRPTSPTATAGSTSRTDAKQRPRLDLEPARRRRRAPHLPHGLPGQERPRHRQGSQRRRRADDAGWESWGQKTPVHRMLTNETYTGTLVWGLRRPRTRPRPCASRTPSPPSSRGTNSSEGEPSCLQSQAHRRPDPPPARLQPPTSSAVCSSARVAARGPHRSAEAKSGKYTYYVCQSLLKRGKGSLRMRRGLNAKRFERSHHRPSSCATTSSRKRNIRELVRMLDEEMDGVAQRAAGARWRAIEVGAGRGEQEAGPHLAIQSRARTSTMQRYSSDRIKQHRERREQLELAAGEARSRC